MAAKRRLKKPAEPVVKELSFDEPDLVQRAGDRELGPSDFPAARVRQAGMTGGETGRANVTADDLAPETLFDDEGVDGPALYGSRRPADRTLRKVSAREAGLGGGFDEAELARLAPLDGSKRGGNTPAAP